MKIINTKIEKGVVVIVIRNNSYIKPDTIVSLEYGVKKYYFQFVSLIKCTEILEYIYEFKDISYKKLLKNEDFYPHLTLGKNCIIIKDEEDLKEIRKQASWC